MHCLSLTPVLPGSHPTSSKASFPTPHSQSITTLSDWSVSGKVFQPLTSATFLTSCPWRNRWACYLYKYKAVVAIFMYLYRGTEILILPKCLFWFLYFVSMCRSEDNLEYHCQTQTTFLGDKILTGLKLAKQVKLAGQWGPVIYLPVSLSLMYNHVWLFHVGTGNKI